MAVTEAVHPKVHLSGDSEKGPELPKVRREQIILGTLFGDGHLHRPTIKETNSRLVTSVASKDEEYIFWKYQELSSSPLFPYPPKFGLTYLDSKPFGRWVMRSKNNSLFTRYREAFYPGGIKIVPLLMLDRLNDLGLAVWYMDDGSLSKKKYSDGSLAGLKICTQGFALGDVHKIHKWLLARYKIKFNVQGRGPGRYILRLSHSSSIERFLSIVSPHVEGVKCMGRKLGT